MNLLGRADQFEVLNGPEDGSRFPVTRTPLDVGADPRCAIHLRLDKGIKKEHARVTVVSDGYRVRSTGNGTVRVNGKRVGRMRSRIVRTGGVLQVGSTLLSMQCADDGLASRSRGMVSEGDLAWALRHLFGGLQRGGMSALRMLLGLPRAMRQHWMLTAGIVGAVVFFRPGLREWVFSWVKHYLDMGIYYVRNLF